MNENTRPAGPASRFETWAIVEIMGHQKFAGFLTEETIAGSGMLRLDVPEFPPLKGFTRYFNTASVYSITPTSEELARQVGEGLQRQPMSLYELPDELRAKLRQARLTHVECGPSDDVSADDDDEPDDY